MATEQEGKISFWEELVVWEEVVRWEEVMRVSMLKLWAEGLCR